MKKSVESPSTSRVGSDIKEAMARRGRNITDDEAESLTRALLDLLRLGLLVPVKETDEQESRRPT